MGESRKWLVGGSLLERLLAPVLFERLQAPIVDRTPAAIPAQDAVVAGDAGRKRYGILVDAEQIVVVHGGELQYRIT